MQNGSLYDVLHGTRAPPILDWEMRYKIAIGIAHGLEYIHYDCDPPIVHRDIKPENILLDSDMEPHISDFGIAKLMDQSSASAQSLSVAGTIGYIAPGNLFTYCFKHLLIMLSCYCISCRENLIIFRFHRKRIYDNKDEGI
jgi:serine/threonine protein kinase